MYSYVISDAKLHEMVGLIHRCITPPHNLWFPVLPELKDSGKVLLNLTETTATCISAEVQKAMQMGHVIQEIYEVHQFLNKSNTLFKAFNKKIFEMKHTAAGHNKVSKQLLKCVSTDLQGNGGSTLLNKKQ